MDDVICKTLIFVNYENTILLPALGTYRVLLKFKNSSFTITRRRIF